MLRKIKFKEFKDLFRKHIVKDFPSSERPNLEGFRKRMLKYNEETYIYEEDGVERGYCIIDQIQEYVLVAFLAVYEGNRGKGIRKVHAPRIYPCHAVWDGAGTGPRRGER